MTNKGKESMTKDNKEIEEAIDSAYDKNGVFCSSLAKANVERLLSQAKKDLLEELSQKIYKIREAVQERHGTFKYDGCYDDCLDILSQKRKELE